MKKSAYIQPRMYIVHITPSSLIAASAGSSPSIPVKPGETATDPNSQRSKSWRWNSENSDSE